jgi:hypothetical protein
MGLVPSDLAFSFAARRGAAARRASARSTTRRSATARSRSSRSTTATCSASRSTRPAQRPPRPRSTRRCGAKLPSTLEILNLAAAQDKDTETTC